MSTKPVLESAIDGKSANSRTVLAHNPELRARFDRMYATLWSAGTVGEDVKELIRLRNARITDCGL